MYTSHLQSRLLTKLANKPIDSLANLVTLLYLQLRLLTKLANESIGSLANLVASGNPGQGEPLLGLGFMCF